MNRLCFTGGEPTMNICPTRVGMNRTIRMIGYEDNHLPHTRGDEPPIFGTSGNCNQEIVMQDITIEAQSKSAVCFRDRHHADRAYAPRQ